MADLNQDFKFEISNLSLVLAMLHSRDTHFRPLDNRADLFAD